jgi:hypothetical protein
LPQGKIVRVCTTLPELFLEAGCRLPDVDPIVAAMAEQLLERLRTKSEKTIRGSVSLCYELAN